MLSQTSMKLASSRAYIQLPHITLLSILHRVKPKKHESYLPKNRNVPPSHNTWYQSCRNTLQVTRKYHTFTVPGVQGYLIQRFCKLTQVTLK